MDIAFEALPLRRRLPRHLPRRRGRTIRFDWTWLQLSAAPDDLLRALRAGPEIRAGQGEPVALEPDVSGRAEADQARIGRELDDVKHRALGELIAAGIGEAFALVGAHDGGAHLPGRGVEDVTLGIGTHWILDPAVVIDERPAFELPAAEQSGHSNSTNSAPSGTCSPTA